MHWGRCLRIQSCGKAIAVVKENLFLILLCDSDMQSQFDYNDFADVESPHCVVGFIAAIKSSV